MANISNIRVNDVDYNIVDDEAMRLVSNSTDSDILIADSTGQAVDGGATIKSLKCLYIPSASFSSLPLTINNSSITSNYMVVNSVLSNPSAQTSDWTVATKNGSLTISGSISGSTTITLYLMQITA